jgi:anti-sigma B factor antagonist
VTVQPRLGIDVARTRGRVVLALEGELDLATVPLLEETLAGAYASDASQILVDLSALTFIDAAGLRALLLADLRSRRDGNRLQMTAGPPQVQRLFEIAGVRDALPFVGA